MLGMTHALTGARLLGGWRDAFIDALIIAAYAGVGVLAGIGLDVVRVDPFAAVWAAGIAGLLAFLSSLAAYRNIPLPESSTGET